MRLLLAALAGAIAMFVWTSIAHIATPLGYTGFSQIPNEAAVLSAAQSAIGGEPGLYFFPWVDPKDPKAMEKMQALGKTNPSGLLLYRPADQQTGTEMMPMLIKEFAKQFVEALIAAFLLSLTVLGGYISRAGFVALMGVATAIATNASYWIWYSFPFDYTLAQMITEFVGMAVAGLAIAAIVRPRRA
ncbi:MAG TPA: hypothetical protein VHW02_12815 [Rhizomicrobium sp.]|jgi:hypothetical protein|nr:hypothetical protein [Rhizomicrobium sp.]